MLGPRDSLLALNLFCSWVTIDDRMLDDGPAGRSLLGMAEDGRGRPRDDMIVGLNNMTDI